ncbi:MAG: hypothetical protein WB760_22175 [Xanthobacteraceae bacterium]
MASSSQNIGDETATAPTPDNMATTTPITGEVALARLRIKAVEDNVGEIKTDIRDIKNHRHTDFVHIVQALGGGFILLATALVAAYFIIDNKIEKLSEKITGVSTITTRVDAKLEDLLARIPPVPTPPPHK